MAAPINNNGGRKSDKLWRDALIVALKRPNEADADKRPFLAIIAEQCVQSAAEGDMQAIKEIGDRIDGKAPQSVTHDGSLSGYVPVLTDV